MSKQALSWCFTINNPAETLKVEEILADQFKYLIYQKEQGEAGTEHLQGYVSLQKRMRLGALKKLLPTAHLEVRRGTHAQAKAYCMKAETRVSGPFEFGVEPSQGKRSDLLEIKDEIDSGSSIVDIAQNHFASFCRYEKGFRSYMNLKSSPRDFKSQVIVLYGPTGTGKSYFAQHESPDAYWYFPQKEGKWWCGYNGTSDVVIDEFYGQIQWSALLRLLDRYPTVVETKGGSVNFAPKRIFITSNKLPYEWYPSKEAEFQTLNRRLDSVQYCPQLGSRKEQKAPLPPPVPDLAALMQNYVTPPPSPVPVPSPPKKLHCFERLSDVESDSDTSTDEIPVKYSRSYFIDYEAQCSDDSSSDLTPPSKFRRTNAFIAYQAPVRSMDSSSDDIRLDVDTP